MYWQKLLDYIETRTTDFFVIGLTGSVAVGKSTLSARLSESLQERHFDVEVVSTDDFLLTNLELKQHQLFDEKGFPKTYHLNKLAQMIQDFRDNAPQVTIPDYSHELADIRPDVQKVIQKPDILIIEGVTALQLPDHILDLAIYVDAKLADIESWYLNRTLAVMDKAHFDAKSWYYPYTQMPLSQRQEHIMSVWRRTNLKNLQQYIAPTKAKANVIIKIDAQHHIQHIEYDD